MNVSNLSCRGFFDRATDGLHGAALLSLLGSDVASGDDVHGVSAGHAMDLKPRKPHFPANAKAVIHLCMQGGPSQVDTFDSKPMLTKHDGEAIPEAITKEAIQLRTSRLMGSPWKFQRYGKSGLPVSELLPHTAEEADELAVIRSMYNVHPNHEPGDL